MRRIAVVVVAVAASLCATIGCSSPPKNQPESAAGEAANAATAKTDVANFSLTRAGFGAPFGAGDLKGKVVIADVATADCTACAAAIAGYAKAAESDASQSLTVVVFADPADYAERLATVMKGSAERVVVLVDPGHATAKSLGIVAAMKPALLSREGVVVSRDNGAGEVVAAAQAEAQKNFKLEKPVMPPRFNEQMGGRGVAAPTDGSTGAGATGDAAVGAPATAPAQAAP